MPVTMKSILRKLSVLIFLVVAACAGMQSYPLGLRANAAPKFFPSLKAAAEARHMLVSEHPNSLNVNVAEGDWLQYMVQRDQINLVVKTGTDGKTSEQVQKRQTELKAVSDELVADARKNAELNKAFE